MTLITQTETYKILKKAVNDTPYRQESDGSRTYEIENLMQILSATTNMVAKLTVEVEHLQKELGLS